MKLPLNIGPRGPELIWHFGKYVSLNVKITEGLFLLMADQLGITSPLACA